MGGVSVESGGGGGRKAVDANINMVPMIDLLVSCIAFLLMTAVWVQTGALQAAQPRGAPTPDSQPPPDVVDQLKIQINPNGLVVGVTQTDQRNVQNGPRKLEELRDILKNRHQANAQQREVWLQPDSAVTYNDIVEVMDVVYEVWGDTRSPGQNIRDAVTIRFL
jgi:biopolymer transport protein TolR